MQGNIHWAQGLFNFTRIIFHHNHGYEDKRADKDNQCDKRIVLLAIIYTRHVLFPQTLLSFSMCAVSLLCDLKLNQTSLFFYIL